MISKFIFRRFLQWRLATVMIIVTLSCLVFAVRHAIVISYKRQAAAATQLQKLGAEVQYATPRHAWLAPVIGRELYRDVVTVDLELLNIKNADLTALHQLGQLRRLYLASTPITDEGLDHIGRLRHLTRLSLWRTHITDAGLAKLANLSQLQALDIHATRISDDGLALVVKNHPQLTTLTLGPRITDEGLRSVGNLRQLKELNLGETWATPAGLSQLEKTPVRKIVLPYRHRPLRGQDLAHLSNLTRLVELPGTVVDCKDEDVLHLRKLRRLTKLHIGGRELTGRSFASIKDFPELKELEIAGSITPDGVEAIRKLNVQNIDVLSTSATAEDISSAPQNRGGGNTFRYQNLWRDTPFMSLGSLGRQTLLVGVGSRSKSREGPVYLDSLSLRDVPSFIKEWHGVLRSPTLSSLSLELGNHDSIPFDVLRQLPELRRLTLRVRQFSLDDLQQLEQSLPNLDSCTIEIPIVAADVIRELPNLERFDGRVAGGLRRIVLDRKGWKSFDDEDRFQLKSDSITLESPTKVELEATLSHPTIVHIGFENVSSDFDFSPLQQAPHIGSVFIQHSHLQEQQWKQVWRLTSLTNLVIRDCYLRDQDIAGINQLSALRRLELIDVLITDKAMEQIAKLTSLRELKLGENEESFGGPFMTDDGLAKIGRLQQLEYLHVHNQPLEGRVFSMWKNLKNLRVLDLSHTHVEDRWIGDLVAFEALKHLNLTCTRISDAGVKPLGNCKNLKSIQAWSPQLTFEGRQQIEALNARN